MPNKTKVATKTSTKTFVALLITAGVLTVAAAFAMVTVPTGQGKRINFPKLLANNCYPSQLSTV
jgi:hypothetical protein